MSRSRDAFDAAFGRDTGDPLLSLIAAARDAWAVGASALQAFSQHAGPATTRPDREAVADTLSTLLGISAGLVASLNDLVGRRAEFSSATTRNPGLGDNPCDRELSPLLMQMWIVCATSTLRYWRDLAEVYTSHQSALIRSLARRTMPQSSTLEAEDRFLADELRGCLREIGDVATQEARRLQSELERIAETVARGFDQPDAAEFYRRRWKAKD
jgi:hypothetical protein